MDISIRQHIINNFKGDDLETLRKAIEQSIEEKDEEVLPGMGVFLEIIWTGADENLKKEMLSVIEKKLSK